jgi:hypothetical protein
MVYPSPKREGEKAGLVTPTGNLGGCVPPLRRTRAVKQVPFSSCMASALSGKGPVRLRNMIQQSLVAAGVKNEGA